MVIKVVNFIIFAVIQDFNAIIIPTFLNFIIFNLIIIKVNLIFNQ